MPTNRVLASRLAQANSKVTELKADLDKYKRLAWAQSDVIAQMRDEIMKLDAELRNERLRDGRPTPKQMRLW